MRNTTAMITAVPPPPQHWGDDREWVGVGGSVEESSYRASLSFHQVKLQGNRPGLPALPTLQKSEIQTFHVNCFDFETLADNKLKNK